jgi:hypothetical protein
MNLASKVWPPMELCTPLLSTKLVDDNGWFQAQTGSENSVTRSVFSTLMLRVMATNNPHPEIGRQIWHEEAVTTRKNGGVMKKHTNNDQLILI